MGKLRENVLQKVVIIFMCAVLIITSICLFVGCNKETPKENTLIIGTTNQIQSINRLNAGSGSKAGYSYDVLTGTISQMAPIAIDENGKFVPCLTTFTYNQDSTEWTFTVIDGMKWHDGVAVLADDLEFTFRQDYKIAENEMIKDIEKVSEKAIKVILNKSNPRFLRKLVTLRIMPKHIIEGKTVKTLKDSESVIGCGPYKFSRWDKNSGVLEFVKFNDYPQADKIKIDKVIFKSYKTTDVMDLALKSGEIDMEYKYSGGIKSSSEKDFKDEKDLKFTSYQDTTNHLNLFFNNEIVKDVNVRKAIQKAINYKHIRTLFGTSFATSSKTNFVSPKNNGYKDGYEDLVRDLKGAKKLLNDAGYNSTNKYNFDLLVCNGGNYPEIAKVLKNDLEETGAIDVTISAQEGRVFIEKLRKHTHQACLLRLTPFGMGNMGGLGSMYFISNSNVPAGNVAVKNNDKITEFGSILESLENAKNPTEYNEAAITFQNYCRDYVPAISLYNDSYVQVYSNKLSGFKIDGTFGILNIRTWETLRKI